MLTCYGGAVCYSLKQGALYHTSPLLSTVLRNAFFLWKLWNEINAF